MRGNDRRLRRQLTQGITRGAGNSTSSPLRNAKSPHREMRAFLNLVEEEGFEPSKPFDLHTFQACSFDHSDTSPVNCFSLPEPWAVGPEIKSALKAVPGVVMVEEG